MAIDQRLLTDVQATIDAGKSLMHENHQEYDEFNRFARYVGRNKVKLSANVAKAVVAGVLTGGIAAAVGLAVTIGKSTVIYVYRRYRKGVARDALAAPQGGLTATTSSMASAADIASGVATGQDIKVVDTNYLEVIDEVEYLVEHGELTNVMNAFADLDNDARALQKLVFTLPYAKCEVAWRTMEYVQRIQARMDGLIGAVNLVQDLVEYSVMLTSLHDEHFKARRRQVVRWIIKKSGSKQAAYAVLNEAANSRGVFHSKIYNSDYTAWARAATGIDFEFQELTASGALSMTGEVLVDASTDYTAQALIGLIDAGVKGEAAAGVWAEASKGVLGDALVSGAADGIASGAGIGIDLALGTNGKDFDYRMGFSNAPSSPESQLPNLIKLHGSLNWFYCDSCQKVNLIDISKAIADYETDTSPYPVIGVCKTCGGQRRGLLVPPLAMKFDIAPVLNPLLELANSRLGEASVLVVVGFSFAEADIYISRMVSRWMQSNLNNRLIIFDPHVRAADKMRRQCSIRIPGFDRRRVAWVGGDAAENVPTFLAGKLYSPSRSDDVDAV
jgi:hypothetical protein